MPGQMNGGAGISINFNAFAASVQVVLTMKRRSQLVLDSLNLKGNRNSVRSRTPMDNHAHALCPRSCTHQLY